MNRVRVGCEIARLQLEGQVADGEITQKDLDKASTKFNMGLDEYCTLQTLKSAAVADGRLTLEEGQSIYELMGESLETFNNQPVHVKVTLTKFFAMLMKAA